jgi:hypothetical protein
MSFSGRGLIMKRLPSESLAQIEGASHLTTIGPFISTSYNRNLPYFAPRIHQFAHCQHTIWAAISCRTQPSSDFDDLTLTRLPHLSPHVVPSGAETRILSIMVPLAEAPVPTFPWASKANALLYSSSPMHRQPIYLVLVHWKSRY